MKLFKKIIIVLLTYFLTVSFLPLKAENNSLDVFYFNSSFTLENFEASLYNIEEDFLEDFIIEDFIINDKEWFHLIIEDYSFVVDETYIILISSEDLDEDITYSFIYKTESTYYINKFGISDNIDDITNDITYATFIDRRQIKFFTKFQISEDDIKLIKNDAYIEEENYTFTYFTSQSFITLDDDLDFNSEYYIEISSIDCLKTNMKLISHNEIYTTGFFETLFNYNGNDLGATYTKSYTSFKVWAPTLNNLIINLFDKNGSKTSSLMEKTSNGVFYYRRLGDLANYEYTYSFVRESTTYEIIDPFVKYISNNNRGLIIDLDSNTPRQFENFVPVSVGEHSNYAIYESSVNQLTETLDDENLKNTYAGLASTGFRYENKDGLSFSTGLDHLKELGITHLTLNDLLNTKYSLSVINNRYRLLNTVGSEISDLKDLIQTLNKNGINVVLELNTYNNIITSLEQLMPGYFYESEYGKTITNNEKSYFETSHYMTNKYLESQMSYLISEFKIKGLKFNPLNSLSFDFLNNEIRELSFDNDFLFYGEFKEESPLITTNKLTSATLLDQVKHIGFIDSNRFSYEESFINSTNNDSMKGYILSSWNANYNILSPEQSFKRLNYFSRLSQPENRQIKMLQLLSYGIPVIKGGEEIGFYSNIPLNYSYKSRNYLLFDLYKTLINFKKEHHSLKILDHSILRNEVIYSAKNDVIKYQIISASDIYPHILIIHNFGDTQVTTLPEGLKGFSHYNRHGEFNWQVVFDTVNYYENDEKFDSNSEIELQKNQSLILHFGLNEDNVIEEPIKTPDAPKEDNLVLYLIISGLLIIFSGIVLTYFILNSTKEEKL